ncbi:MAG: response regulator transcription factor [Flavobacteriales bacterium]|nr:response regulator transcription factor [Flavobacteriales bacterium]
MVNIIIVEDHQIVRQGLKLLLSQEQGMQVVADFDCGEGLLRYLKARSPILKKDNLVLLLDINLPGKGGFEVLMQMQALYPTIPVLVLSMYSESTMAIRMLRAGASGYMHKDADPNTLITALKQVSKGQRYVSASVADQLVNELRPSTSVVLHERLSAREFEVFLLLGEGYPNNIIAQKLVVSPKTVSTFKVRVLKKMNMQNQAEIVRYILEKRLKG